MQRYAPILHFHLQNVGKGFIDYEQIFSLSMFYASLETFSRKLVGVSPKYCLQKLLKCAGDEK